MFCEIRLNWVLCLWFVSLARQLGKSNKKKRKKKAEGSTKKEEIRFIERERERPVWLGF